MSKKLARESSILPRLMDDDDDHDTILFFIITRILLSRICLLCMQHPHIQTRTKIYLYIVGFFIAGLLLCENK